ncbi:MAG TPA: putative glycolipid-binding domain-containing protein [Arthrobacter sp.]|nr:putative glycolipid-binding domain-containing protein [Arthrobacter sp.]
MTPDERIIRDYSWQGEDDPARLDAATVIFRPGRLSAHGISRTHDYALSWALETGDHWITRSLAVSVHGQGWSRWLELGRTPAGVWTSRSGISGATSLPPPGITSATDLSDALDCDLGLCPMTNTMPIRRLNLLSPAASGQEPELTVAWVDVPSLRVFPSRQRYGRSGAAAHAVHFSSEDGFTAELATDEHGVVTGYPGLARLLP